jgi:hypothetical protein
LNEWVRNSSLTSLRELIDLVRAYARQETIGELRGTWRWLAWGSVGALSILLGFLFLLVGILRLIQAEFIPSDSGLTWLPYFIVIGITIALIVFSQSRIRQPFLNKASK